MKRRRMLLTAGTVILSFLLVLSNVLLTQAAEAIDESQKCTLALKFHGTSVDDPVAGVKVYLYQAAKISTSDAYTLIGDFSNLSVSISNDLSSSEWNDLAVTLKAYAESEQMTALQTGSTGDDGIVSFSDLSVGLYLVTADDVDQDGTLYSYAPVLITLPYINAKDDSLVYDTSSSPVEMKGEVKATASRYSVVKHWSDSNSSSRPSEIKVNLIKNGAVDSTVTLNDADNWTWSWHDMNHDDVWEVAEADVPFGYTVSVSSGTTAEITSFTITNTIKPGVPVPTPSPSQLPFTGQHWGPAMALAAGGLGLLAAGLLLMRRHD